MSPSLRRFLRRLDVRPDRYRGAVARTVHDLTAAVIRRETTADRLLDELQACIEATDMTAEFARFVERWPSGDKVEHWLCRRRHPRDGRDLNMRLQLFYLKPQRSEPPHYHDRMASLQCVLKGRIHCRQYDRVARNPDGALLIRPVAQRALTVGETFRMTDHECNIHWFGTEDEPAVVLDFFIAAQRLYETPFDADATRPGRHYLDPTGPVEPEGLIAAPDLGFKEAYRRFASSSPLAFEWNRGP